MDNGESPVNWEREAAMYQNALETALEYQRQLEARIEKLERFIASQEETINEQQDSLQEMVLASYARELEKTIEAQAEQIQQFKQTLHLQQRLLRRVVRPRRRR
jgi:hypothetical protein